jgi:hypothetical protein
LFNLKTVAIMIKFFDPDSKILFFLPPGRKLPSRRALKSLILVDETDKTSQVKVRRCINSPKDSLYFSFSVKEEGGKLIKAKKGAIISGSFDMKDESNADLIAIKRLMEY